MKHSHLTVVAIQAALRAGELLKRGFGTQFKSHSKTGIQNLVTEYDTAAEEAIISYIKTLFPDHAFLAEESGRSGIETSSVLWLIDPLDGTVNFANNIPIFCVSIAALVQKTAVCGVIYHPLLNELFIAEKGQGAFLNGRPIRVSNAENFEEAVLATGFPYNVTDNPHHCIDQFGKMVRLGVPIRRLGSAAIDLAYVACGRFDAYWEESLNPWDHGAGKLLVEEAGGKTTDISGGAHDNFSCGAILASNGKIHTKMIDKLRVS